MMSLSPLATRVGAWMFARRESLAKSRIPHSMIAAACASRTARFGAASRPSVRVKMRLTNSKPLAWLASDGLKKRYRMSSAP
jgi:hypothetical protein